MRNLTLLWVTLCCLACTGNKYAGVPERYHDLLDSALARAGENAAELKEALRTAPDGEKEGMAYLIAYMPERDLKTLNAAFLLINNSYAYRAREQYPWAKALPDSIFLNDVLPYVSLNEKREAWRPDFYQRFGKYVEGCKDIREAISLFVTDDRYKACRWTITPAAKSPTSRLSNPYGSTWRRARGFPSY